MDYLKTINEEQRINELKRFEILDTDPEINFDEITQLASAICKTKISYISFIDSNRQWFKSTKGIDINECPRDISICAYAINFPNKITEIPDATIDDRFKDNPSVTGPLSMVFYASIPLVTENNMPIGTLCVLDSEVKRLSTKQKQAITTLSRQVVKLLELRIKNIELEKTKNLLQTKNLALEKFTKKIVNSVSSPINSINLSLDLIASNKLTNKVKTYIGLIKNSSIETIKLVEELKEYHKNIDVITHTKETIIVSNLLNEIKNEGNFNTNNIIFEIYSDKIFANKLAMRMILIKVLSYRVKENINREVKFISTKYSFSFIVEGKIIYDDNFIASLNFYTTNLEGEMIYTPEESIKLTFKKS